MATPKPTGVQVDRPRRVVVMQWNDGLTAEFGFDGLRAACPCVECKGGHANMGSLPNANIFAPHASGGPPPTEITISSLTAVGAYAVQITFSDGHGYGIYSWEYFYELRTLLQQVRPDAIVSS